MIPECTRLILYHAQCCYTCYFLYIQRNDGADRDKYHTFRFMLLFEFLTDSVTNSFPAKSLPKLLPYRSTYDGTDLA